MQTCESYVAFILAQVCRIICHNSSLIANGVISLCCMSCSISKDPTLMWLTPHTVILTHAQMPYHHQTSLHTMKALTLGWVTLPTIIFYYIYMPLRCLTSCKKHKKGNRHNQQARLPFSNERQWVSMFDNVILILLLWFHACWASWTLPMSCWL